MFNHSCSSLIAFFWCLFFFTHCTFTFLTSSDISLKLEIKAGECSKTIHICDKFYQICRFRKLAGSVSYFSVSFRAQKPSFQTVKKACLFSVPKIIDNLFINNIDKNVRLAKVNCELSYATARSLKSSR